MFSIAGCEWTTPTMRLPQARCCGDFQRRDASQATACVRLDHGSSDLQRAAPRCIGTPACTRSMRLGGVPDRGPNDACGADGASLNADYSLLRVRMLLRRRALRRRARAAFMGMVLGEWNAHCRTSRDSVRLTPPAGQEDLASVLAGLDTQECRKRESRHGVRRDLGGIGHCRCGFDAGSGRAVRGWRVVRGCCRGGDWQHGRCLGNRLASGR